MKFLVCGLGSIGQRHVRMLRLLFGNDLEITACRRRGLPILIHDDLTAEHGVRIEEHYGLRIFHDLESALDDRPDGVLVTNPISMHVETALQAAKRGIHLFVEKPLGHSMEGVDVLSDEARRRGLTTMVGYQLRFHPALQKVRELLSSGRIGRPLFADLHFGEWLPGMHPYEDYRESHAARADQGGGAILCLSHEIDLASWLFGRAIRVAAMGGHLSELEMSGVEDVADVLLTFDVEGRHVPVHVHLDFVQRPPRRYGRIVGELGALEWNYAAQTVTLFPSSPGSAEVIRYDDFKRNDMFLAEIGEFVTAIREGRPTSIPLEAGVETLKLCLAARRAMQSGTVEVLS